MRCSKSSSKREVYSDTGLPQERKKTQMNNLTYHLKELEKEEVNKAPNQQKEGNNKDQKGNK